ncbi:MAG: 50S ribosomal protein L11 methyltransferase, partial [Desulfobacterales bacterium]
MEIHQIRKAIVEHVAASAVKITPRRLAKTITDAYRLDKARIKALLKDLVAQGELEYVYEFGSSYLVPSFNRPVRISAHVVIMPPGYLYSRAPDDVIIQIKPGAAFGGGRHPSTRLSVEGIEFVLKEIRPDWLNKECSVLDIGTGSAILAIVAVCLGIRKAVGIDIDPCAVSEAGENIVLNHFQDRITISDRKIDALDTSFSLIVANLRYPSLKKLYRQVTRLADPTGGAVFSGFRPHEKQDLIDLYTARYFRCI